MTSATPLVRSRSRVAVAAGILLVFVLAEVGARIAVADLPPPQGWSTPETQYKVGQIEARGHAGTVFVGSSVVDAGVDPGLVDATSYNAALGAATMPMIVAFTRHVVIPALDPDTVVIGVSSRELNANLDVLVDIERDFFRASQARHAFGTEDVLDRLERRIGDASTLFRYRRVLRDPDNWFGHGQLAWGPDATAPDGRYLGFTDTTYRGGPRVLADLARRTTRDFAVGDDRVAPLHDLIAELVGQGRRVVLLAVPVTADYVEFHPRGSRDFEAYVASLTALAAGTGVEFVDAGVWDPSFMADPLHVNGRGARRLSALLREVLGPAG